MITNNNAQNTRKFSEVNMSKLEHATALHTTLPMEDLIGLFAGEIRDLIVYDSFEFENSAQALHLFMGTPKLHKCRYILKTGGVEFGQITLTRVNPFKDSEINVIEGALGALAIHLNNAMTFESSISADALVTLKADRKRAAES